MDDSFKLSLSQKDVVVDVVGDDLKNANICPFLTPLHRSLQKEADASKIDAYVVSVYMADRLPFVTRYRMKTTSLHRHNFFLSFFFCKERGLCYRNRNEQVSSHQREGKNCEEPFRFCCNALFHTDNRGSTSSYVFAEIKVKKKERAK